MKVIRTSGDVQRHIRFLHASCVLQYLTTAAGTVKRKILESYYINKLKPAINNKEECKDLERYLVQLLEYIVECVGTLCI